jgi:5'-phosphate synthase pdxT subunit
MLHRLETDTVEVRLPEHLRALDGIILPGGESTTIGKLLDQYGILEPLRDRIRNGLPVYGTCAGMILLAKDLGVARQPALAEMDIRVRRNAFGSQLDSFECDLNIEELGPPPFHAVFIRAPIIERVGEGVQVLAWLENGTAVAARQGTLLVSAFHPELSNDPRFHRLFLEMCGVRTPVAAAVP